MKLNYNILWVDDYPKDMKVQISKIKEIIKKNYLIPIGLEDKQIFKSYGAFIDYLNKRDPKDFSDTDLILVDYNLSDSSGYTGVDLINNLRKKNIYTDVIFYSGNIDEALKTVKSFPDGLLDNVTYTDNSMHMLVPRFESVLNKQLMLIMQISDLRGYLMDSTSDFDFIMRGFVKKKFPLLKEIDKNYIFGEIDKCIETQNENENKKFAQMGKLARDNIYVNKAMDSQEYVMTVKNKIYIMALIMQKLNAKSEDYAKTLSEDYYEKIIQYRNKLAHTKLLYGQKQSGHIKIAKNFDDLDCDCEKCNAKLTRKECEQLRAHIFKYYSFFNELLKDNK